MGNNLLDGTLLPAGMLVRIRFKDRGHRIRLIQNDNHRDFYESSLMICLFQFNGKVDITVHAVTVNAGNSSINWFSVLYTFCMFCSLVSINILYDKKEEKTRKKLQKRVDCR